MQAGADLAQTMMFIDVPAPVHAKASPLPETDALSLNKLAGCCAMCLGGLLQTDGVAAPITSCQACGRGIATPASMDTGDPV